MHPHPETPSYQVQLPRMEIFKVRPPFRAPPFPPPLSSFTTEDNLVEALPEPMPEGQSNKAPIRAGFAACSVNVRLA